MDDWRHRAACAQPGVDPDTFFPGPGRPDLVGAAKAICGGCLVRTDCLNDALNRGDIREGVCGGLTADERAQLSGKRPKRFGHRRTREVHASRPKTIARRAIVADLLVGMDELGMLSAARRLKLLYPEHEGVAGRTEEQIRSDVRAVWSSGRRRVAS